MSSALQKHTTKGRRRVRFIDLRTYSDTNPSKQACLPPPSSAPMRTNSLALYDANLKFLDSHTHPSRPYVPLPLELATLVLSFLVGIESYLDSKAIHNLANEAKDYDLHQKTKLLDFLIERNRIREAFHISRTTLTLPTVRCKHTDGLSLREMRLADEINPTDETILNYIMGIKLFESDYEENKEADQSLLTISKILPSISFLIRLRSAMNSSSIHAFRVMLTRSGPDELGHDEKGVLIDFAISRDLVEYLELLIQTWTIEIVIVHGAYESALEHRSLDVFKRLWGHCPLHYRSHHSTIMRVHDDPKFLDWCQAMMPKANKKILNELFSDKHDEWDNDRRVHLICSYGKTNALGIITQSVLGLTVLSSVISHFNICWEELSLDRASRNVDILFAVTHRLCQLFGKDDSEGFLLLGPNSALTKLNATDYYWMSDSLRISRGKAREMMLFKKLCVEQIFYLVQRGLVEIEEEEEDIGERVYDWIVQLAKHEETSEPWNSSLMHKLLGRSRLDFYRLFNRVGDRKNGKGIRLAHIIYSCCPKELVPDSIRAEQEAKSAEECEASLKLDSLL